MAQDLERRRHPRIGIAGHALACQGKTYVGQYLVEQLSAGGALLADGPDLPVGAALRVLLRWPRQLSVSLNCHVVRRQTDERGGVRLAVAFRSLPAFVEDQIHSAVLSAMEHKRDHASPSQPPERPCVLVVDDSAPIRSALARAARAFGLEAISAGTHREAIFQLNQDSRGLIRVAIVDLHLDREDGLALLGYVAEHHPGLRRILISGEARPAQLQLARHSKQVDATLTKPWNTKTLCDALAL
jgi:ActR/RegA family two-component response regulator